MGKDDIKYTLKTNQSNGNHGLMPDSSHLAQQFNKKIPWCCKNGEVTFWDFLDATRDTDKDSFWCFLSNLLIQQQKTISKQEAINYQPQTMTSKEVEKDYLQ